MPLDVELASAENPWLQIGERFKDNPLLDEVSESIAEYRRQLDARPTTRESVRS